MEKKYYDLEEIEKIFNSYRDPKESNITPKEYKIFCCEIKMLPAFIINTIYKEIYFVFMSGDNIDLACNLNLRDKCFKKKKGIVIVSSYILGTPYLGKNGKEKTYIGCVHGYSILHEIAHHILNHSYKKGIDIEEDEAWARVKEWEKQYSEFQENE